ncbi:MAG: HD domain-containing protein [Deltaproteobacteria bacterium]|nr:HD domain-containing protein [Deltaproteobacteria bacterium]
MMLQVFNTRLARRLFVYVLGIAMLPILIFGYLTHWQMDQQIERTHDHYLFKTAEMFNQLFFNRVLQLEDALRMQAAGLARGQDDIAPEDAGRIFPEGRKFFVRHERRTFSAGHFSEPELRHLQSGHVLLTRYGAVGLAMAVLIPGRQAVLLGVVRPEMLWGIPEELPLPQDTSLMVLDAAGFPLFQSKDPSAPLPEATLAGILSQAQVKITFQDRSGHETCYSRELFLESHFLFPRWTLVLRQENSASLTSQSQFMTFFPLIVALCLGLVLYMILVLIRRTLAPLGDLRAMTDSVARQDFDAQVSVYTGDEIEELGHAFNAMAGQLKLQFSALRVQADIDRQILSALNLDAVVHNALEYFSAALGARRVLLGLWDSDTCRVFGLEGGDHCVVTTCPSAAASLDGLVTRLENSGWMRAEQIPELALVPDVASDTQGLVCAIPRHGVQQGFVCLEGVAGAPDSEELVLAGQTLDQLAVAFTNIRLVRELKEYSWGTLEALARAVDEKSPWTSGHSHRVAALAIDLAVQLGWSDADLDDLHRAALLHDLGKIGIATEILDKPGALSAEKFAVIRTHPDRGAKILEPVRAYAAIIPLVRHHHERMDGSGYPLGLKGEAIPRGARILAVADVYDALTSNRPYRDGWPQAKAEAYLLENAGKFFDPKVVRAFLAMR